MRTITCSVVLSLVAVAFVSRTAEATEKACVVSQTQYVTYQPNSNNNLQATRQLWIQCVDGTTYYANINNPSTTACPQTDIDSIKEYTTLANASKLSGQSITIGYNPNVTCSMPTGFASTAFTANVIRYVLF